MNSEIKIQLEQIAFDKTIPFCYSCYSECLIGRCAVCGSDDLMRLLPEHGCEYGTDWVINVLLKENLTPADLSEAFEESIRQCYPENTKVGWMEFDTITLMRENDPISWKCALSEYESQEESEENIISFDNGSTYYWSNEIEQFIADEIIAAELLMPS